MTAIQVIIFYRLYIRAISFKKNNTNIYYILYIGKIMDIDICIVIIA